MSAEAAFALSSLRVLVDPARAADYARETGLSLSAVEAPLAYPALWLTAPQIHDAVERICAEADCVPVHEQQRFIYETPLRAGLSYDLQVVMRREEAPPRLVIEGRVATLEGAPVARIEAKLRLVSRALLPKADA